MASLKADTSGKREGQNWGKTAILISSPYFKEIKHKSNPTLYPNQPDLLETTFRKMWIKIKEAIKEVHPRNGYIE